MTGTAPFHEVLQAADQLSSDDREALVAILQRRLAEEGRQRVIRDVQQSREEFAAGDVRAVTPEELTKEILE